MKKFIGIFVGLSLSAAACAENVQLSPTIISNPQSLQPNSAESIHVDMSKLPLGVDYNIKCMLRAQKNSGGVYAAFLTKHIKGAKLMFAGKVVILNKTVVVKEKPQALKANEIKVGADKTIIVENRDGKHKLLVSACEATPSL